MSSCTICEVTSTIHHTIHIFLYHPFLLDRVMFTYVNKQLTLEYSDIRIQGSKIATVATNVHSNQAAALDSTCLINQSWSSSE